MLNHIILHQNKTTMKKPTTYAEEYYNKFKKRCATKVVSTGKHCPNIPSRTIKEGEEMLCEDCFFTYSLMKKAEDEDCKRRKCNHHPFDRDVTDCGTVKCLNCGSSYYDGLGWS